MDRNYLTSDLGGGSPELGPTHLWRRALLVVGALVILVASSVGTWWYLNLTHTSALTIAPSHVVVVSVCGAVSCRTFASSDVGLTAGPEYLPGKESLSSVESSIPATLPGMSRMDYLGCPVEGGSLFLELADGRQVSYDICPGTPAPVLAIWRAAWGYQV